VIEMRPLHPAVVHFLVACWVLAALLDATTLVGLDVTLGRAEPAATAAFLVWTGLAFAVVAVAAGLADYTRLPTAVRDSSALTLHVGAMAVAFCSFLVAALLRPRLGPAPALVVSLEVLGTVALVIGGHYAASVVFSVLPSVHASRDAPSDLATFKESKP